MRKITFSILIIVGASVLSVSCNDGDCRDSEQKDTADLVVYGKIFTADQSESIIEAFAVKDGKFVCAGTKDEAAKHIGANTEVIDYTGNRQYNPRKNDNQAGSVPFVRMAYRRTAEVI